MRRFKSRFFILVFVLGISNFLVAQTRWSTAKANNWYRQQPWLVGSNFVPANASNQLEMWQAETFDAQEIDKELGWAEGLGMNTMRVFLHDLLWQQDPSGFTKRIDMFLAIAAKHHIRPIFVLFDSCWNPKPTLGLQPSPKAGVHNSAWVQGPGGDALRDPRQYPRLKAYVRGVVGAFADDPRVLAWDVWNEPDNTNSDAYGKLEPQDKAKLVAALLPQVFEWARSANPSQPLTSGVWQGNWSATTRLSRIQQIQLSHSDVISFHNYSKPEDFEKRVLWLKRYGRPILCTEYMARTMGSTFDAILPIAKKHRVGAINWGFVIGKTQTNLPWDSWRKPYVTGTPPEWFHDVFYPDGKPYKEDEAKKIRELTGAMSAAKAAGDE